MVTCTLYFVYCLHLKKWNFLIRWFLSFYCCYIHRHTEGDLRGFKYLPETLLSLFTKSLSHSRKNYKNNLVSDLLDFHLEALVPHKTVSLCLWLYAIYILLVVLYSFMPLKMELFIDWSMFMKDCKKTISHSWSIFWYKLANLNACKESILIFFCHFSFFLK